VCGRDNFKVMFSSVEELTVFKLLELACVELMKLSFQYKSQEGAQTSHRSVYCRMLWGKGPACSPCTSGGVESARLSSYSLHVYGIVRNGWVHVGIRVFIFLFF